MTYYLYNNEEQMIHTSLIPTILLSFTLLFLFLSVRFFSWNQFQEKFRESDFTKKLYLSLSKKTYFYYLTNYVAETYSIQRNKYTSHYFISSDWIKHYYFYNKKFWKIICECVFSHWIFAAGSDVCWELENCQHPMVPNILPLFCT